MRMLAVDMDDTCLNSKKRISPKTLEALKKAAAAGIEIVPTTVRALSCLPHQLWGVDFIRYVISSNGAVVTDLQTKQVVHESLIPQDTVSQVLKRCRRLGIVSTAHINYDVMIQGLLFTFLGKLSHGQDTAGVHYAKNLSKYVKANHTDAEFLQLICLTPKSSKKTMALLEQYPDLISRPMPWYIDVYAPNTSKGNAVAALASHLNIPKEEIACIGDSIHDLQMFSVAGLKLAMGNAEQVLKDAADHVVPTNDEDGVAAAIEKYLL